MRSQPLLLLVSGWLFFVGHSVSAGDRIELGYEKAGSKGVLTLHSTLGLPVSGTYPEYTVLCSTNLQSWFALPELFKGGVGVSDERLRVAAPLAGDRAVYKVVANIKLADAGPAGASVYGYATQFGRELQQLGQLSLDQFVSRFGPANSFLPQISFDPTAAEYWTQFNASAFQLNASEAAVFQTNGFVVSERLGTYSFADQFYRIYSADLPVFFSTDAALHAWHRSFTAMLEELEETYLAPKLEAMLRNIGQGIPQLSVESLGTAMENGVLDADLFVAVGQSLVTGTNNYGARGQYSRIQTMLNAIAGLQPVEIELFGTNRVVDFSQFQVRGHYTTSQRLQRYFRAMMWCGIADLRFTGSGTDNSLGELSGAVALNMLLTRANQFASWEQFDGILRMFVGLPDSLNFAQLGDLLSAARVYSPPDLPNLAALQNLQVLIMSGQLGVQDIRSGYFFSPLSRVQIKLPRSFTVMGQRFTLDGWALSQCTFDSIIWDEDGVPGFEDKVLRRVPSALDVAFGVLGNDHAVPHIAARIANTGGHPWRDGKPYQHNLAAVRNVVEAQDSGVWTSSIYSYWLGCLRELSRPTTGLEYPEAMRTRGWAMKTLNTQLASWTELKHDTVLYAKQPYTGSILCLYPDGFVEPRTNFWSRMREMAVGVSSLLTALPRTGQFVFEPNNSMDTSFTNSLGAIYTNRLAFMNTFANTMATLEGISQKELQQQPLSAAETEFLRNLAELTGAYTGVRTYSGWYPSLFYLNARARRSVISPCDQADQLVTDVHTDTPALDVGDPGSILHEGVGNVLLLMLAVDSGANSRAVYAGPVFSHYEFELGPATRQTDTEWRSNVQAGNLPPQPDWTRDYQVPAR